MLEKSNFSEVVCRELGIKGTTCDLTEWTAMIEKVKNATETIKIAIIGKYVQLHDSYLSVVESLKHAGFANDLKVEIEWIDSEEITKETVSERLKDCKGVVVPGGFGNRGVEGKIEAVKYVRENNIPFLGICLGMQVAAIEFARNVLGYKDANSREFDELSKHTVIDIMESQKVLQIWEEQ